MVLENINMSFILARYIHVLTVTADKIRLIIFKDTRHFVIFNLTFVFESTTKHYIGKKIFQRKSGKIMSET
jgi:hypothetical protein